MDDFADKIAVVTGGGSGMGYELVLALAKAGCHVATCDLFPESLQKLQAQCARLAPDRRISTHHCDVADEAQLCRFRDEVQAEHETESIHLLFNNAGIGGGGSMIADDRKLWERTFGVCWFGVYYGTRTFLPLLQKADEACIVNISSINGIWASVGPTVPHTAYSAAKFAVRGFTEALITDLRLHAPHIQVAVVMPGHISTGILENSGKVLGRTPEQMSEADLAKVREQLEADGLPVGNLPDAGIRALLTERILRFRQLAPTTAAEAVAEIMAGVRAGNWRILVGDDARALDQLIREIPEEAYEESFIRKITDQGHLSGLIAGVS